MPALQRDMAGIPGILKCRAPGFGELLRPVEGAKRIRPAGDQMRPEGQGVERDRLEITTIELLHQPVALPVRGGNQISAAYLALQVVCGMGHQDTAERMGDQNHRAGGRLDIGDQLLHLRLTLGLLQPGLFDEPGIGNLVAPAQEPMAGQRFSVAGNQKNIGVCDFHGAIQVGFGGE